jgi:hypothetical protein
MRLKIAFNLYIYRLLKNKFQERQAILILTLCSINFKL